MRVDGEVVTNLDTPAPAGTRVVVWAEWCPREAPAPRSDRPSPVVGRDAGRGRSRVRARTCHVGRGRMGE